MNYSKAGIKAKEAQLNSLGPKFSKKFGLIMVRLTLIGIIALAVIGTATGIGVFKGILDSSPDITNIDVTPTGFSTFIYDKQGRQTAKLVASNSNRIPVGMDMIPENLANAFVAVEDERFYSHNGIDIKGIIRAGAEAFRSRKLTQGASTITQQLLKNNVFTSWTGEDSDIDRVKRKIQEQYLAIELEKRMSKEDILLNYMNTINLGQNTLGVQAASLRYFNKNVYELNLSECAVIAGITQNPSRFNPISHPEKNAERREKVLRNMHEQGMITDSEWKEALADDVYSRIQTANETVEETTINSYFDDAVTEAVYEDLLAAGYNDTQAYTLLYSGGLSIYSTQDPDIQKICNEVAADESIYPTGTKYYLNYSLTVKRANGDTESFSKENFKTYFKQFNSRFNLLYDSSEDAYAAIEEYQDAVMEEGDDVLAEKISITPQPQISLTIEDQHTGEIVAMIGGRGSKEASRTLNRATSTMRQPGSTFKVVSTYAPALDSAGLTLATVFNDAPFNYDSGTPVHNWYTTGYRGINSLRMGITQSMNIITVKCLTQIGPQLGFEYLRNFGFTTLVDHEERYNKTTQKTEVYSDIQQSLALGGITYGVTNKELNSAYATIANEGVYIKPKLYTKVVDHDGNVILDNTGMETRQVLKPTTAYLLTSAMQDVVTSGTGGSVNFGGMAIAGKTGTTSDYNDVWFAGYTPYYTCTTWTGYDNNVKLSSSAEKNFSKTLWRAVMSRIHENLEYASFPTPGGLVTCSVCASSGKLPVPGLCDGHVVTEMFTEDTVPTETCDVHYAGTVCTYSMLPACDTCPFKAQGVFELPLHEDASLLKGTMSAMGLDSETSEEYYDGTVIEGEDGVATHMCPHNALFMAAPNVNELLAAQQLEMQQKAAAQAAALQAAGLQTTEGSEAVTANPLVMPVTPINVENVISPNPE